MSTPVDESSSFNHLLWGIAGCVIGSAVGYKLCQALSTPNQTVTLIRDAVIKNDLAAKETLTVLSRTPSDHLEPTQQALVLASSRQLEAEQRIDIMSSMFSCPREKFTDINRRLVGLWPTQPPFLRYLLNCRQMQIATFKPLEENDLTNAKNARKGLVKEALRPFQDTLNQLDNKIASLREQQTVLLKDLNKQVSNKQPAAAMKALNALLSFHNADNISYDNSPWANTENFVKGILSEECGEDLNTALDYMADYREDIKEAKSNLQEANSVIAIAKCWETLKGLLEAADLPSSSHPSQVEKAATEALSSAIDANDKNNLRTQWEAYENLLGNFNKLAPQDLSMRVTRALLGQQSN